MRRTKKQLETAWREMCDRCCNPDGSINAQKVCAELAANFTKEEINVVVINTMDCDLLTRMFGEGPTVEETEIAPGVRRRHLRLVN